MNFFCLACKFLNVIDQFSNSDFYIVISYLNCYSNLTSAQEKNSLFQFDKLC